MQIALFTQVIFAMSTLPVVAHPTVAMIQAAHAGVSPAAAVVGVTTNNTCQGHRWLCCA